MVESEEFLGLTSLQVGKLISSDRLTVPSEEKVRYQLLSYDRCPTSIIIFKTYLRLILYVKMITHKLWQKLILWLLLSGIWVCSELGNTWTRTSAMSPGSADGIRPTATAVSRVLGTEGGGGAFAQSQPAVWVVAVAQATAWWITITFIHCQNLSLMYLVDHSVFYLELFQNLLHQQYNTHTKAGNVKISNANFSY